MGKGRAEAGPSEQEVFEHILSNVKAFLLKNGLHIALMVLVVVVVVVLFRTRRYRYQRWSQEGWETIGSLPDATFLFAYPADQAAMLRKSAMAQCRAVLEEGPRTEATPWLLLKLAQLQASGEEWAAAEQTYKELMAEYGSSPVGDMAKAGLAAALEEMGQYAEAAELYESLAEGGQLRCLLGAGRSRELIGDVEAAEADYHRILESDVTDYVRGVARARLAELASGRPLGPPPEPESLRPAEPEFGPEPISVPEETSVTPDTVEPPNQGAGERVETE